MYKLVFVLGLIEICARKTLAWPQSNASSDEMQKDERPIESLNEEELVQRGLVLLDNQNYDDAVQYIEKAVEKNPNSAPYLRLRCDCYSKLGKVDEAIKDCERAVEMDKSNKESWTMLIGELFELGKYNEAIKKAFASDDIELIERLGARFYFTKDYERAVRCYTEAIERDPNDAENYLNRGLCFQDMKEKNKAIADFRKAINMPSETGVAERMGRYYLREMLLQAGEYEKLVEEIILSDDPMLIATLASTLITKGRFDEAIRCYTAAIDKEPGHVSYYEKRGFCFKGKGDLHAAIRDFKTAVHKEPLNKHFWLSLTTALIQNEDFYAAEEALKNYEKRSVSSSDFSRVEALRRQIPENKEKREKNQPEESSGSTV